MKIVKFYAENIKRLKAVEITPDGNTVILSGKNEQGKTTVLDSIWWALGGAKDIQEEPIRQGETRGLIKLDLGDMIVIRKFSASGTTLEIINKEGLKFPSPQAVLDKLMGRFTFDVTKFLQTDKRSKVDTLLDLVRIEVDPDRLGTISGRRVAPGHPLDMLNSALNSVIEDRKVVNRDLDRAKKALESMPEVEPAVPVSIKDLIAEKESLENQNRANAEFTQGIECYCDDVNSAADAVEKCVQLIESLGKQLKSAEENLIIVQNLHVNAMNAYETYLQQVSSLVDADLTDINNRIASADETNRRAQAYADREAKKADKDQLAAEFQSLTDKLTAIRNYKEALIANAKFPIDGLNFAGGGVTYKGVPLEQASSAEQLQVSIAIAMALNPTLRVIRIDNASLFDSEHLALIEKMAQENDYQVWMEVVDESGKVGIVIEDGQVKETDMEVTE